MPIRAKHTPVCIGDSVSSQGRVCPGCPGVQREAGGTSPQGSPARRASRICPVYAPGRKPARVLEEYFLSSQIAKRFGEQENMTEERSSSTLPLMASVGLAWFAPDYTVKRVRLPPLSFPFVSTPLPASRASGSRRAGVLFRKRRKYARSVGLAPATGCLLSQVFWARAGRRAATQRPEVRLCLRGGGFPGPPPESAKNGPRRPGNGKY